MSGIGTSSGRTQSAVIVPVPAAEPLVGRWRAALDPVAAAGVPAHVTLVVPWISPTDLAPDRLSELAGVVAGTGSFSFSLVRTAWFGSRVLWVAPEPDEPFRRLTRLVAEHFGTPPWGGVFDELVPHLTVAHAAGADAARLDEAEAAVGKGLPCRARAEEVQVMCSDGARWSTRARIGLDPT